MILDKQLIKTNALRNSLIEQLHEQTSTVLYFKSYGYKLYRLGVKEGTLCFALEDYHNKENIIVIEVPYSREVNDEVFIYNSKRYTTEVFLYCLYIFIYSNLDILESCIEMGWRSYTTSKKNNIQKLNEFPTSISDVYIKKFLKNKTYKYKR